MKSLKIHLALLLLGVFLYPEGFRYVHVMQHHTVDACGHGCVHHDAMPRPDPGTQSASLFESPDHCAIIEYTFPPNRLPEGEPDDFQRVQARPLMAFALQSPPEKPLLSALKARAPPLRA